MTGRGDAALAAARRRLRYLRYRAGLLRPAYAFGSPDRPRRISIVIPDSLGDVAVNVSVTSYFKQRWPDTRIALITHPRYTEAARFNPHYDAVFGYGGELRDTPPWLLTHADQVRMARELTPDMDRLFLCQPSAWCEALAARYPMVELQNRICQVPPTAWRQPRLRVPPDADQAGRAMRDPDRPAVFLAREAHTLTFGVGAEDYCHRVAADCVRRGVRVYWNSAQPLLDHELCVAVGAVPLAQAVSLATQCTAVVSMRSGFTDLVGLCAPDLPVRVFYPDATVPGSRMTWLRWCSLVDMGVTGAVEQICDFATTAEVDDEVRQTTAWLSRVLATVSR
ncbi:MAG TPA: hypothetical protein VF163_12050 [Micromonosporaceae bacterium]